MTIPAPPVRRRPPQRGRAAAATLLLAAVALLAAAPVAAQGGGDTSLRRTLDIERRLLLEDLAALDRARSAETEARNALNQVTTQLRTVASATVAGSGAAVSNLGRLEDRLETASDDLAAAGERSARALARLGERLQRLRLVAQMLAAGEAPAVADVLSGTWRVTVQPGGGGGVFELRQDSTLVYGTFRMEDGRRGSLRGTFVGRRVLLERVDTERGFDSIFDGVLAAGGRSLSGSWQPTDLADGGPGGGDWQAVKTGGGS